MKRNKATVLTFAEKCKNTIIDERGSFAVSSPYPVPARIALSGDVLPLKEDKAKSLAEKLQEVILSEKKAIKEFTCTVSGVLSSSASSSTSQSDNLQDLLGDNERYTIYRFKTRSCTFVDGLGGTFDVDIEDLETSKADPLGKYLVCKSIQDTYITSIDRKGFDVLAKVTSPVLKDGIGGYQWKEFRFMFKEEANNVEMFCSQVVEMEKEVINKVSTSSGLK
ncbi:hypothetical protein GYH30_003494 [Glycine max]|nr:hypothetical protein GYH30_003494 [Glycine max]